MKTFHSTHRRIVARAEPARAIFRAPHKQSGLSLVELMVAMTIGLFLMLVVANLFIGSKQTYRNQDNLSRLQENGRFAISLMAKNIREAGYHSMVFNPPGTMYTPLTNIAAWPYSAAVISGVEGTSGLPDSITLSSDNTVDCMNATVTTPATNTFTANASAQLTCTSVNNNKTAVLLDGVEDMQILYGENLGSTHRYVPYGTTGLNMGNVDTVRICMLLRTLESSLTVNAQTYTDCKGNSVSSTDGRIREAFSETFSIRSRTQ